MRKHTTNQSDSLFRIRVITIIIGFCFTAVIVRLFYWQVIRSSDLTIEAFEQYQKIYKSTGSRGEIITSDNYPLVSNQTVYRLFVQPQEITQPKPQIAQLLASEILKDMPEYREATDTATQKELLNILEDSLKEKLERNSKWVNLKEVITPEAKERISALGIAGIGFDPHQKRYYPEASMAAHLTGFVGKNDDGEDTGYFGIEGALDQELKARQITNTILGISTGTTDQPNSSDGRTIITTIRRDIQHMAEDFLKKGIDTYGAESGEVLIVEPQTGKIRALAAYPSYNQDNFIDYDSELYKNPSLSSLYEPGSTFKVLTVAAGIDAKLITAETTCPVCHQARTFGQYTIRTWNDVYNPNITMRDALAKSDNTAMIYIAEKLGAEKFQEYLKQFGIGSALQIDLQGDIDTPFPSRWGPVELATISFGQGISVNSLQMVRALTAIANQGKMMKLQIIESVIDPTTQEIISIEPEIVTKVISAQTAHEVTSMMVHAAKSGEAQWIASKTHTVAGKTGTSSVAVEGGYAEDETIASFIGFAPPEDPQFLMLVKLNKPQSSPWASETAAPLWYDIAEKLYLYLGIPGDK